MPLKLNIPKSILNRIREGYKELPIIGRKKNNRSEAMKKLWADPIRRAELCEKCREAALKRKYSAKGYSSLQRHMHEKVNIPEVIKKRDKSYTQTPEFREKGRIQMTIYNERMKKEKKERIEILERVNDFCGVLTESDMATM